MSSHLLSISNITKVNVSGGSTQMPRGSQKLNRNIQLLKRANFSVALFGQG